MSLTLVVLAACGSSATLTVRDSTHHEGEIVAASREAVVIKTDDGPERVMREDIVDIDHPGNVAGTIGVLLAGYGAGNIALGFPQCDENGAAYCIGVIAPAALGLVLAAYGLRVWRTSVIATRPAETRGHPLHVRLAPVLFVTDRVKTGGLQLAAEF